MDMKGEEDKIEEGHDKRDKNEDKMSLHVQSESQAVKKNEDSIMALKENEGVYNVEEIEGLSDVEENGFDIGEGTLQTKESYVLRKTRA